MLVNTKRNKSGCNEYEEYKVRIYVWEMSKKFSE